MDRPSVAKFFGLELDDVGFKDVLLNGYPGYAKLFIVEEENADSKNSK